MEYISIPCDQHDQPYHRVVRRRTYSAPHISFSGTLNYRRSLIVQVDELILMAEDVTFKGLGFLVIHNPCNRQKYSPNSRVVKSYF